MNNILSQIFLWIAIVGGFSSIPLLYYNIYLWRIEDIKNHTIRSPMYTVVETCGILLTTIMGFILLYLLVIMVG